MAAAIANHLLFTPNDMKLAQSTAAPMSTYRYGTWMSGFLKMTIKKVQIKIKKLFYSMIYCIFFSYFVQYDLRWNSPAPTNNLKKKRVNQVLSKVNPTRLIGIK